MRREHGEKRKNSVKVNRVTWPQIPIVNCKQNYYCQTQSLTWQQSSLIFLFVVYARYAYENKNWNYFYFFNTFLSFIPFVFFFWYFFLIAFNFSYFFFSWIWHSFSCVWLIALFFYIYYIRSIDLSICIKKHCLGFGIFFPFFSIVFI